MLPPMTCQREGGTRGGGTGREVHTALLGGSFDPPHLGHLLLSEYVLHATDVREVWWVPCAVHALGKRGAPFADRLALGRAATRRCPAIRVSGVEGSRDGPSYTIDTVEQLARRHPERSWSWIVGSDLLEELPLWHRWSELAQAIDFIVVRRGPGAVAPPDRGRYRVLPLPFPDVSSTQVRRLMREGRDADGLVDVDVLAEIRRRGLYR